MAGACRDHRDRGREHPCAPGLYAIWSAVGIAPVAVFGKILFNDPVPPLAMAGMVLIVGGVVLVGMSGPPTR